MFLSKMGHPRPLFRLFLSFQTNITILTTNIREKMLRPSSLRCRDSNPRPLEHESPPKSTRPGLPPNMGMFNWWYIKELRNIPIFIWIRFLIEQNESLGESELLNFYALSSKMKLTCSVTRLGYFLKRLVKNFPYRSGQIFGYFWSYLENII